ncbi:MAG: rhodanese-related sulfurtransferase [Glaciihabitans sp.]|nr:rhodanese-related sulfurtransferase [Glaciihabitans sp.]
MTSHDVLISAPELAELLDGQAPVRVLDVRWRLDRPDGSDEYRAGHIPGAVYVDLDHELASHGQPTDGRHPLPTAAQFQDTARGWGINDGDTVVVYDNLKSFSAARAWWLLRYAGFESVRILDGSLRAWTSAGYDLATGDETATPGTVNLGWDALPVIDINGAAAFPADGVLLDSRAPERYRGETEPMDPKAGHIPGAVNAPSTSNVDADGRFLAPEVLRAQFLGIGVSPDSPVAAYCGSGVMATHNAVALTLAGFTPAVYPGSWSQWSNHPDRPVAVGDEAG